MKHLIVLFVVVCISLTGCSNAPQNAGPSQPAPQTIFVPVPVTYPRIIIEPDPPYCDFICIQFTANGKFFCDSDCDGWFDDLEVEFGHDPCNPFDPSFAPDTGGVATVCEVIFGKGKNMTEAEATLRFQSQQHELSNP